MIFWERKNSGSSDQSDPPVTTTAPTKKQFYQPDFICYNNIIIEIKAVRELTPQHKAQLLNYLHATKIRVGLLVN